MIASEKIEGTFREEHEMDETQTPDDRLELMFPCCHPSLALEIRFTTWEK